MMKGPVKPGPWRLSPEERRKRRGRPPQPDRRGTRINPQTWSVVGVAPDGRPLYHSDYYNESRSSPRVKGRLILRDNPHTFRTRYLTGLQWLPDSRGVYQGVLGLSWPDHVPDSRVMTALRNEAYAKLRGKLYKNSASLGVTLGSWGQSSEMIIKRLGTVKAALDLSIRKYTSNRSFRERQKKLFETRRLQGRETLAGDILEVEFGWAPLFQDVRNSFEQMVGNQPPPQFVKGKATGSIQNKRQVSDAYHHPFFETKLGSARVTMSATVTVSNPNIWMLNKLGLLNPAVVAWDLVPWSFVVNMFVNVNALLNSLTDFVGLSFGSVNSTESALITHTREDWYGSNAKDTSYCKRTDQTTYRVRTLHSSPPKPSLQFRVPQMNLELMVIAGSLVVQRFHRLNNLLGLPPIDSH